MSSTVCALCAESKTLRKSHIIPNAVFRKIKQGQNSGQLIQFDDSEHTPVHYSQDSWWEYLLCAGCERVIGKYEQYGLALLRGRDRSIIHRHLQAVTFRPHDYRCFKLFLTSILWRAAISKQPYFTKVILPDKYKEEARISLLKEKPLGPLRLGCKILRLTDKTSEADGGFSPESLEQLVVSPLPRLHKGRSYYTILFLIEGFLLEYFVPAIPHKSSKERGVHKNSPVLFVPLKSIFDIPELVKLMVSAYGKQDRGLITFKKKKIKA
jgi:hypothetical protein